MYKIFVLKSNYKGFFSKIIKYMLYLFYKNRVIFMFGKVLKLDNNEVTLENLSRRAISNLMNCHIVFEDETRRIIGEVIYVDEEIVRVLLVGEIVNNVFISGIIKKPSGITNVRIITIPELELIFFLF